MKVVILVFCRMNDLLIDISQTNFFKKNKNTIEVKFKGFHIEIIFLKNIDDDNFNKFDRLKVKRFILTKYQDHIQRNILELFSILNLCYSISEKIPKYSLKFVSDKRDLLAFKIEFELIENLFLSEFLSSINKIKINRLDNFSFLKPQEFSLTEDSDINILQTNTKTRRLGYLKIIIRLFDKSNYYPKTYLNKKIESKSAFYENDLFEYGDIIGDNKGIIKRTANGTSAKPYVVLLEELNLITLINNSYILTKQSKIYFHFYTQLKNQEKIKPNNNLFDLNLLDKIFFLRQILISDSLYLWSILDILFIAQKPLSTMSIKKLFVDYIQNELERNLKFSINNNTKRKITELKKRISEWEKPLVYLEHIIEPRINWLVDLDILEIKPLINKKQYYFSKVGNKFINVLLNVYERNLNKQLILQSFFNRNYLKTFNYIYDLNKTVYDFRKFKIEHYLLEAFQVFKTSAPNRIAASQGIDYVCFKLFFDDDMILESEDLKKYLQKENTIFSMDWFNTENDGAIYLKK